MGSLGPQLEFRILGPLEVLADGAALALGGPKQRALLAVLALDAGRVVSLDRLTEDLWGDSPPKNATTSLHVYVSHLRKVLEPDRARGEAAAVLASQAPGYVLAIEPGQLDLTAFEALAARGRQELLAGIAYAAAATLHHALDLWRGPALADFLYEPFAQSEIARLEELRLSCTEDRIDADLGCGLHDPLVAELETLTRAHPLRERLHVQLMLALYRAGRQAEALAAYAATRERLVNELGIDPGPALQELNRAILNQDAALTAPSAPPPEPAAAPPPVEARAAEPEPVTVRETRRVVTVLCARPAETGEPSATDPEVARRVMRGVGTAASTAIERHGGKAEVVGDGSVLGVFGVPSANEDDAMRALRAAADLREALASLGLGATVAVHTGEVIAGDGAVASGEVRRTALGLELAAEPGEILLTDATRRLVPAAAHVEAVEPVALRGRAQPLRAWRLVELVEGAPAFDRRLETPLVGRAYELEQLRSALARAERERILLLFTLLGSAGVGKSRLMRELLAAVGDDATVLVGKCLSYGEGVTFLPLQEIVDQAAGAAGVPGIAALLDGDAGSAELLGGLLGLEETEVSAEEAVEAVRALVEALAAGRSLLLVVDDIHWAEPALLDLLDQLADLVRDVPVLLLCLARPELLDARPTWAGGKHNAVSSSPRRCRARAGSSGPRSFSPRRRRSPSRQAIAGRSRASCSTGSTCGPSSSPASGSRRCSRVHRRRSPSSRSWATSSGSHAPGARSPRVHLTRCHWGSCAEALEHSLEHAGRGGGTAELAAGRIMLANALYYGPTPVTEARERCEELRTLEPTHPVVEANILCYLGGLAALEGRYDEARELHGRGRGIFEELGHAVGVAGSTTVSGPDRAPRRRSPCRRARAASRVRHVRGDGRDRDPLEPRSPARGGRPRPGERHRGGGVDGRERAGRDGDDAAAQIAWRMVRAVALARRGEKGEAQTLAAEAVTRAAETDFLVMHAAALVAQAEVLRAAGDGAQAGGCLQTAAGLYDTKGARVAVDREVDPARPAA